MVSMPTMRSYAVWPPGTIFTSGEQSNILLSENSGNNNRNLACWVVSKEPPEVPHVTGYARFVISNGNFFNCFWVRNRMSPSEPESNKTLMACFSPVDLFSNSGKHTETVLLLRGPRQSGSAVLTTFLRSVVK